MRYSRKLASEIDDLLYDFVEDDLVIGAEDEPEIEIKTEPKDEWDEITAVESPKALLRTKYKSIKKSGEYLRDSFTTSVEQIFQPLKMSRRR